MKQWKKVTALFCLALSLVFVSACGGKAATGNSEKPAAAPAAAKAPARAKKTLVVYYTNTHRTEQAAKVIAKETGGDLLLWNWKNRIRKRIWTTTTRKAAFQKNTTTPSCGIRP